MNSGIYLIQVGDRKYVGQAKNINKRWTQHKSELRNNNHPNCYMQRLYNKYKDQFEFLVLEYCDEDELNDREVYYINLYNTLTPNGMNLKHGGDVRTYSDETKKKMSKSHKGLHIGSENGMWGKSQSKDTLKLMSSSHIGKKMNNPLSNYFGVTYDKSRNKWKSFIVPTRRKIVNIGRYLLEIDAAKAYDKYVIENNLDRPLNFGGNHAH